MSGISQGRYWSIALILCLAQASAVIDRYLISVVTEPLRHSFRLSDAELGFLSGPAFVTLFVLASIPLGRLADRRSRRYIIVGGVAFWSVATGLTAFVSSYQGLVITRLGVGLGEAALMPAAVSLISSLFEGEQRSKAMTVYALGTSAGRVLAFIGGGLLLGYYVQVGGLRLGWGLSFSPWQSLFIWSGVFGLGLAVVAWFVIVDPRERDVSGVSISFLSGLREISGRSAAYFYFFGAFSFVVAAIMAMAAWMVSLFVRKHGVAVSDAGILVGFVSLVGGPVGGVAGGYLLILFERRRVAGYPMVIFLISLVVLLVCGLILPLSRSIFVTSCIYGVAYSGLALAAPVAYSGISMITPLTSRGFVSSLFLVTYTLVGAGVGPFVVGIASDVISEFQMSIAIALGGSLVLFSLLGIPCALLGRRHFEIARVG